MSICVKYELRLIYGTTYENNIIAKLVCVGLVQAQPNYQLLLVLHAN